MSCPPADPAPKGQHGYLASDCATNDCAVCYNGGQYPIRVMQPVLDLSEGEYVKYLSWKQVERKTLDGRKMIVTEKVQETLSPNAFATTFKEMLIKYREHFHEWQFQAMSERLLRFELMDKKEPHTFHYYYDLSENYSMTYKWAPQSTHWGNLQVVH